MAVFAIGLGWIVFRISPKASLGSYCAFCDPKVQESQVIWEESLVQVLYTYKPIFPGHCLVIPKRHVERFEDLSKEEMAQMGVMIQKVHLAVQEVFQTSAYFLLQKNGVEVGQTVPHVHIHYVPRKEGDKSFLSMMTHFCLAPIKSALSSSDMAPIIESLRNSMHEKKTSELSSWQQLQEPPLLQIDE